MHTKNSKTQNSKIARNPIMGKTQIPLKKIIDFIKEKNPNFNSAIAEKFLEYGDRYGIAGDVAICQSIHETNWFLYGGVVKPEQNNYAGIGASGGGKVGNSFATIGEGVKAQIQHLYAYATNKNLPEGESLNDPRFNIVARGSAPFWEDLAGRWAYPGYDKSQYKSLDDAFIDGETYGQKIMVLYSKMKGTSRFKDYTIDEFAEYIEYLQPLKRIINHIQIHHTWKPKKSDYKGESTIFGMWRYHTQTNKWNDIAQHFSISPDGMIWSGRDLEMDPAGISKKNEGGLMFEIIGDFDIGQDILESEQLKAILSVVKVCLKKFNMSLANIVFHRDFSSKTCPGTGIPKEWFLEKVESYVADISKEEIKIPIVVLDPGHGGTDIGANINNIIEKNLALDLAFKVREWLINCYDVKVFGTRDIDKDIKLSERVNFANSINADFFVSLHHNEGTSGFETYAYPSKIDGKAGMMQNIVHEKIMSYLKTLGVKDGGKKEKNYLVLRETNMPAILIQNLFASNGFDASLLKNIEVIQELAKFIAKGIAEAMGLSQLYPTDAEEWKKESVGWLFSNGFLTASEWKNKIEEPLPLWAESIVLKKLYEMIRDNK